MDAYVSGFQSSDIKVKLATVEKFLLNLNRPAFLSNAQNDVRNKAMSGCVALVRDANPKVAQLGLDCMRLLITNHAESFQPLVNMSFDILLNKFSDNKQQIRTTSTELMLCLFNLMDLSIGVDRLANQLNHKNFRIREQVLVAFGLLQEQYQTTLRSSPSIVGKIAALLSDQQGPIRQLATETLVKLYHVFGNSLASLLEDCEVKTSQIKSIMDAANPHHHSHHRTASNQPEEVVDASRKLATTSLLSTAAKRPFPGVENTVRNGSTVSMPAGVAASGSSSSSSSTASPSVDKKSSPARLPSSEKNQPPPPPLPASRVHQISQDDILALPSTPSKLSLNSTSSAAAKRHVSASRVRPSLGSTSSAGLATPSTGVPPKLSLNFISSSSSPQDGVASDSKFSPAGSDISGGGFSSSGHSSTFDPAYFMGLLRDGTLCAPLTLQNERDMQREFLKVKQGLANTVNWNVRITALQHLQRLCHGNLADFDCAPLVKQQTDAIVSQISDLRSVICKEACRALAVQAFFLGSHFRPLSEQWFPCLIKVVCVKIAVMSSAADRCIRVLVAMHPENRLLTQILDSCVAKNAQIRSMSLEYLSLAASLWKYDILDKNFSAVKNVLQSGLVDADGSARRAARILFLILQSRVQFQGVMDQFLKDDLDPGVQKYIQVELASPSPEVTDLLHLSRNPSAVVDFHRDPVAYIALNSGSSKVNDSTNSFFPLKAEGKEQSSKMEAAAAVGSEMKPSRRLSMTTGPVRLTTAQKLIAGAPIAGSSPTAAAASSSQGHAFGATTPSVPAALADSSAAVAEYEEARDRSVRKMLSGGSRRTTMSTFDGLPHAASTFRSSEPVPENVSTLLPPPPTPDAPDALSAFESSLGVAAAAASSTGSRRASIGGGAVRLADGPKRIIRNMAPESASTSGGIAAPSSSSVNAAPAQQPAGNTVGLEKKSAAAPVDVPSVHSSPAKTAPEVTAAPAGSSSQQQQQQPAVFIFSGETLRAMSEDGEWSMRLKAFESISQRLQRAVPANEALNAGIIESFIELGVAHMGDVHHRVAAEALQVIQLSLASFSDQAKGKLGTLVTALFHRLADRRPAVKDQANSILNQIRVVFDPLVIMAALSPKITEIPDRMKTALMQFLGAIAPYCTEYFNGPQNTWAFLGRMSNILGCGGSKPSVGLTVAGKRLLELVYKTSPKVVCGQMSSLTYQQQTVLKKLLGDSVPDIDTLVMVAGRSLETNSKETAAKVRVDIEFNGEVVDLPRQPQSPNSPAVKSVLINSPSRPPPALLVPEEVKSAEKPRRPTAVQEPLDYYDSRRQVLLSPPARIDRPAVVMPPQVPEFSESSAVGNSDSGNSSPPQKITSPSAVGSPGKATLFTSSTNSSSGVGVTATSVEQPPRPTTSSSSSTFISPVKQLSTQSIASHKMSPSSASSGAAAAVAAPVTPPHLRDTIWLLKSMQPEAPLVEKMEAAKELKLLAKTAEDSYWQKNFAQIVSVLLESFSVHSKTAFSSITDCDEDGVNESLHIVAKMLHLLVRYRGAHVKNFVDLLVSKLCVSAETAVAPLVLLYEHILIDIGHYEPAKMVAILTPFAHESSLPQVRLLTLHVISETIHFMTSSELLSQLPLLVPSILPSFSSDAVDMRKAVVFVLVEIYLTVNDALFPFLTSLQASQRKLLTIYIEKKLATRKASVA